MQSLYRAVKKAPATHKLGAIYAIDSVVRRWIESAKQQGQSLNFEGRGEPGTPAAAMKRVTELMPALVDDIVKGIPMEQKEKFEGMLKIWEKGNTFPAKLLEEFRTKLKGAQTHSTAAVPTTGGTIGGGEKFFAPIPTRPTQTPTGTPPQHLYDQGLIARKHTESQNATPAGGTPNAPLAQKEANAPAPVQNVDNILSMLANAAVKPAPSVATPQQNAPQQTFPANIMSLLGQQNGTAGMQAPPAPFQQANGQANSFQMPSQLPSGFQMPQPQVQGSQFQFPQAFPGFPPQPPPSVPQQKAPAQPPQQVPKSQEELLAPLLHMIPPNTLKDQAKLIKALEILQDLQKDGIPPEQWPSVLQAFDQQYQPPQQPNQGGYGGHERNRDRSMSPDRRRRGSPVYDSYDGRQENDQGRGGRNRFRQRSPLRDSPPPSGSNMAVNGNTMQPKYIGLDSTLPRDNIKVLSRTLFVGGAVGSQQEIHDLFSRFGRVQTCIANREKRHAFVKMTTRNHALAAKENLERLQSGHDREVMNIARQTKWGVGFGPRECCSYAKGESVIPIHKLTEADVKWLLSAEYGGTGGQKIEGGMVLEEPDIEIGAGVSSKAMSKRVTVDSAPLSQHYGDQQQQQQQGYKRPREDFGGSGGRDQGRGRDRKRHQQGGRNDDGYGGGGYGGNAGTGQMEAYGYARPEPVAVATPPAVPGFGFSLGGGQGGYR